VQVDGLLTALGGKLPGNRKIKWEPISETKGYIEKHEIIKSKTKRKI
jgi:hypothetical protein